MNFLYFLSSGLANVGTFTDRENVLIDYPITWDVALTARKQLVLPSDIFSELRKMELHLVTPRTTKVTKQISFTIMTRPATTTNLIHVTFL